LHSNNLLPEAETFAYNLCLSAGVTIPIPGQSSSTTAAPPASSSAPPPPTSHAGGVSTVYVTVCSASSAVLVVPTTKAGNVSVTATQSAHPSVFTGAAAAGYVSGATMFGGVMAAMAMLL